MTDDEMKRDEQASGYVRAEDLAKILGLTVRRVQQLRADGALVTEKTKYGQRYHLLKSLVALVKHLMSRQDAQSEKQRALSADADYKERKAALMQIELRKRRGEVHEAAHVRQLMNGMILDTKALLTSLPGRIAHDLRMCSSENEIATCLRDSLFSVMDEMRQKQYDPDRFKQLVEEDGDFLDIGADDDEE